MRIHARLPIVFNKKMSKQRSLSAGFKERQTMPLSEENEHKKHKPVHFGLIPSLFLGLSVMVPISSYAATWSAEELAVFQLVNQQRSYHGLNPVQQDDRLRDAALGHAQSMAENDFFSHTTLAGSNAATPGERITAAGYEFSRFGENIAAGQGHNTDPNNSGEVMDRARDVMFGTENFDEINNFFDHRFQNWGDLGEGLTNSDWDAWNSNVKTTSENQRSGGWMGSSGHRTNILNGLFDDIGVGYVWDDTDNDETVIQLDNGGTFNDPLYTYWAQSFASGDTNTLPPSPQPSPVPLPAAFWLLGSGLISLMVVGKRRRPKEASYASC
jgi:uncharacterized protein YkwD